MAVGWPDFAPPSTTVLMTSTALSTRCKATGHIASKATARFTSCRLRLRSSDRTVLACGGEVLAAAILDRLLHRAHVLNIKGRSYRLRNLEDALKLSHA